MLFSGIAIYHAFKIINKYKKNNASLKIETKWLERLLFLMILVLFLWISIFTYNSLFTGKTNERTTTYLLWISMSLLTYRMGYLGIYHLGIFNQREAIRKGLIKEDIENKQSLNTLKGAHNSSNRFTEIDAYINKNKSYLDSNLTLTSLSEIFNLSEGYLSQLINTNTGINFSTYINQLRIEESKILLTNPAYKNYTIIAVALESGFNSKSVFYVAFKKQEGISPSEFKKTAKNLS
ncbi:MAG: AraC family transcriptional regulator [Polaribacter sp.]|uniref:helix-turn-helix domain-containing protein n=1 Tax=Polaribacter sp. TaxID=1920175 RepID=UPI002F35011B